MPHYIATACIYDHNQWYDNIFGTIKSLSLGPKFHEAAHFHTSTKWHSDIVASLREFEKIMARIFKYGI